MSKSKRKKKTTMVETTTTLMENALNRSKSRVSPQNDVVQLEKHLPNGDLYTGTFLGNIPHGSGKYLWSDGCMYEGEWKKGKANGNGKFSWPSGATYEGEFKGGRMEGQGTFTGPHGDTYTGSWVGDKKHGYGVKRYANGDCYDGNWKRNLQEGVGNYVWKNGNWYTGEWRGGVICGKGVLSWDHGGNGNLNNSVSISDCRLNVGRIGSENSIVLVSDCKSKLGRDCGFGSDCVSKTIRVGLDVDSKTGRVGSGPKLDCEDTMVLDCKMGVGLGPELDCENTIGSDCRMCVGLDPKLDCENNLGSDCKMGVGLCPKLDCENSIGSDCRMCVGKGENSIGSDCKTCVGGKGENSIGSDCDMSVVGKGDIVLDCNMSLGKTSNVGLFPRICIWESEGEAGDITCDIIDNVGVASMIYGDGFLGLDRRFVSSGIGGNGVSSSPCCFIKEAKKPGQTISKGHKNYDLMLNLQLGIRYSVGKHSSILRELKPRDFDPKEKFWTRFPPEGSKLTPTHKSTEFRWKDYCPVVFRHLRDLFQVDPADYMLAVCGNDALRELSSPGKSGSFFYLTQDDRFMIKTVKKSEVKVLLRMLPSYYQHVYRYENTLVTRFYGVHCVKPAGGAKTRFIVMGNLFCSEYRIHRRFDLKGSRHGRTTEKAEGEIDETTTLKDLDLDFVFRLQRNWYQELIKQIERDCEFLEAEKIMDYSLLVGIHFRNDNTGDKMGLSPFVLRGKKASYQNEKYLRGQRFLAAELQDMDRVLAGRKPLIRLGANMPARAERLARRSDFDQYVPGGSGNLMPSRNGEIYEIILYFGIIDILQDYDITKRLEHAYKSLQADPTSISAVDPQLYSKRFRDFIGRIFVEDR